MQYFPLKIKRHNAKTAGSRFKAAMLNFAFRMIEDGVNREMATLPDGTARIYDGVQLENRFEVAYEDFRAALDRLGEKGRTLEVFKGNPRDFRSTEVLRASFAAIRRRVFGTEEIDEANR